MKKSKTSTVNTAQDAQPASLMQAALAFETVDGLEDAEKIYLKLLSRYPDHAPAWHARGLLALRLGRPQQATEFVAKAARLDETQGIYQRNLTELYRRQGLHSKAALAGRRACKLLPDDLDAHYNLGLAYTDARSFEEAAGCFRQALKLMPQHSLSWNNLGSVLEQQGHEEAAREAYEHAINANPENAEAHNNLGVLLNRAGAGTQARLCFEKALQIRPDFAPAQHNLQALSQPRTPESAESLHLAGISHYQKGNFPEALAYYEQALSVHPDHPEILNSKGFLLQDMDRMPEALACFQRAVELAPEYAIGRLNLGMAQLKLGYWEEGWKNYEARWTGSAEAHNGSLQTPVCPLPLWDGKKAKRGTRILVITEQGFGDTFQFARYLPLLASRFAKTGFVAAQPTARLLEWSLSEKVVILNRLPADYAAWDVYCPLMSLPKAFGTCLDNIPAELPYLRAPSPAIQHWKERLEVAAPGRFRIGIAWAGRKAHQYDSRRSLSFWQITPLLTDDRITWVSLQKWAPEDARPAIPAGADWIDWTEELSDFADTAALLNSLDLIISIDSAMVHLAGALDKPVWMLNRFDGEWRWLQGRSDSPWYPGMRIFNQPAFGDWDTVIRSVSESMQALSIKSRKVRKSRSTEAIETVPIVFSRETIVSDIPQAMQRAAQLQSSGQLRECNQILQLILSAQPEHAHALHLAGIVAYQSGQHEAGIQQIEAAIRLAPGEALFFCNLAEMLRQQGKLTEAIRYGECAVTLAPSMANAFSNLGIAYFDAGDLERSAQAHQSALRLNPQLLQSLNNLGSLCRARHSPEESIQYYRRALDINPNYLEALSNLSAVLLETGNPDGAATVLERALTLKPDAPEVLCNLGITRFKQGKMQEAEALLVRSIGLRPSNPRAEKALQEVYKSRQA